MSSTLEIGKQLVEYCLKQDGLGAVDALYDEKIVSIEGAEAEGDHTESQGLPQRMEGIEAVRGKNQWWYDNHEIHDERAVGPFCGHRDDQFAVLFDMDVTNKPSGERTRLSEVALYTVANGKIVEEQFLYLAD